MGQFSLVAAVLAVFVLPIIACSSTAYPDSQGLTLGFSLTMQSTPALDAVSAVGVDAPTPATEVAEQKRAAVPSGPRPGGL